MNPNSTKLLGILNNKNFFGATDMTEEQFDQVFSDPAKQEQLRTMLNSKNFFGDVGMTEDQFSTVFFSSPSPEEDKPVQFDSFSVKENQSNDTVLPDVQLNPEVFDVNNLGSEDATQVDLQVEDPDKLGRGMTKAEEFIKRYGNQIAEDPRLRRELETIVAQDLYQGDSKASGSRIASVGANAPTMEDVNKEIARLADNVGVDLTKFTVKDMVDIRQQQARDRDLQPIQKLTESLDNLAVDIQNLEQRGLAGTDEYNLKVESYNTMVDQRQSMVDDINNRSGLDDFTEIYNRTEETEDRPALVRGEDEGGLFGEKIGTPVRTEVLNLTAGLYQELEDADEGDMSGLAEVIKYYGQNLNEKDLSTIQSQIADFKLYGTSVDDVTTQVASVIIEAEKRDMKERGVAGKGLGFLGSAAYQATMSFLQLPTRRAAVARAFIGENRDVARQDDKIKEMLADPSVPYEDIRAAMNERNKIINDVVNDFVFKDADSELEALKDMIENPLRDLYYGTAYGGEVKKSANQRVGIKGELEKIEQELTSNVLNETRRLTDKTWEFYAKEYEKGNINQVQKFAGQAHVAFSNASVSANSIAETMMFGGAGVASMSTSVFADGYAREFKNIGIEHDQLLGYVALTATMEAASGMVERYLGTNLMKALPKVGKARFIEGAVDDASGYFNKLLQARHKNVGGLLTGMSAEGVAEGMVKITENMTQKYVNNKEEVNLMDGVAEAFATGMAMAGTMGSATSTIQEVTKYNIELSEELSKGRHIAKIIRNQGRFRKDANGEFITDKFGNKRDFKRNKNTKEDLKAQLTSIRRTSGGTVGMDAAVEGLIIEAGKKHEGAIREVAAEAEAEYQLQKAEAEREAEQQRKFKEALKQYAAQKAKEQQEADEAAQAEPEVEETVEPEAEPEVEETVEPEVEETVEPEAEPEVEETVEPEAEPEVEETVEEEDDIDKAINGIENAGGELGALEVGDEAGTTAPTRDTSVQKFFRTLGRSNIIEEFTDNDSAMSLLGQGYTLSEGTEIVAIARNLQNPDDNAMVVITKNGNDVQFNLELGNKGAKNGDSDLDVLYAMRQVANMYAANAWLVGSNIKLNISNVVDLTQEQETMFLQTIKDTFGVDAKLKIMGGTQFDNGVTQNQYMVELGTDAKLEADVPLSLKNYPVSLSSFASNVLNRFSRRTIRQWGKKLAESRKRKMAKRFGGTSRAEVVNKLLKSNEPEIQAIADKYLTQRKGMITENNTREEFAEMIDKVIAKIPAEYVGDRVAVKDRLMKAYDQMRQHHELSGMTFDFLFTPEDLKSWQDLIDDQSSNYFGQSVSNQNHIVLNVAAMFDFAEKWSQFSMVSSSIEQAIHTHLETTMYHELFHNMIDTVFAEGGAFSNLGDDTKRELATQVLRMFKTGGLKFASEEAQNKFSSWLKNYSSYAQPEEVLVEVAQRIKEGQIVYDKARATSSMKALLNDFIKFVAEAFGFDNNFMNLSSRKLRDTAEGEAWVALTLMYSSKTDNNIDAATAYGSMEAVFAKAQQRVEAKNAQSRAKNKRKFDFAKSFKLAYGKLPMDPQTEEEFNAIEELEGQMYDETRSPDGGFGFTKLNMAPKSSIQKAIDGDYAIVSGKDIDKVKAWMQVNNKGVFLTGGSGRSKHLVLAEMSLEDTLRMMNELNLDAMMHKNGILYSDGSMSATSNKGQTFSMTYSYRGKDGKIRTSKLTRTYSDNTVEGVTPVQKPYDAKLAQETANVMNTKPESVFDRLGSIANSLRSLGFIAQAKAVEIAEQAQGILNRYRIQIGINYTKQSAPIQDVGRLVEIDLDQDTEATVANKIIDKVLASVSKTDGQAVYNDLNNALKKELGLEGKQMYFSSVLIGVVGGNSKLTEQQQIQLAKTIIASKNSVLKTYGLPMVMDDSIVDNESYRMELFANTALEMLKYRNEPLLALEGTNVGVGEVQPTKKYVTFKDTDYTKPRQQSAKRVAQIARQYEVMMGLPEGSVVIPMFDINQIPANTPIITVPHDRMTSGKVRASFGTHTFDGSGIAMFHPERRKAGVVYMSDKAKVAKMVQQAKRIAAMIAERDGVPAPNNVTVSVVMGKDNFLSNKDTADFFTKSMEHLLGAAFDKPMTATFINTIKDNLIGNVKDVEYIDEAGNVVKKKSDSAILLGLLNDNKKGTVREFFEAYKNLSFADRRSVANRFTLAKVRTYSETMNKKAKKEGKRKPVGNKLMKALETASNELFAYGTDQAWATIPDKHIFMMYEIDIAKTEANLNNKAVVPHKSYDTDVYGKPLGLLQQTAFYGEVVTFDKDVMRATSPATDQSLNKIYGAYKSGQKKVEAGTATAGTFENIVRMGREAGNTGLLDASRTIPAQEATESTGRVTSANIEYDGGVRQEKVEMPPFNTGGTGKAVGAATSKAQQQTQTKQQKESVVRRVKNQVAQAINDMLAGNIESATHLSEESREHVINILKSPLAEKLAAFITMAEAELKINKGTLLREADSDIVKMLMKQLDITSQEAQVLFEALSGRKYKSEETSTGELEAETYRKMLINGYSMYEKASKLGTYSKFAKWFEDRYGIDLKIENVDSVIGDSNAILLAKQREFMKKKINQLNKEQKRLEKEYNSLPDGSQRDNVGMELDMVEAELNRVKEYIDEIDAYGQLDRSKSIAQAKIQELEKWYFGSQNAFVFRVNKLMTMEQFNDYLKAFHIEERMQRNIEMIEEAQMMNDLDVLETKMKLEDAEEGSKTERNLEIKLRQLEKTSNELANRMSATKSDAQEKAKEAKMIKARYDKLTDEQKAEFESLKDEMVQKMITERIELLVESGVLSRDKAELLLNGDRGTIATYRIQEEKESLTRQLADGDITQEEYNKKLDAFRKKGVRGDMYDIISKARKKLEEKYKNGEIDNDQYLLESQKLDAMDASVDFKYTRFENYVPLKIKEDKYVEQQLIQMLLSKQKGKSKRESIQARQRALNTMYSFMSDDILNQSQMNQFSTLSAAQQALYGSESATRQKQRQDKAKKIARVKLRVGRKNRSAKNNRAKKYLDTTVKGLRGSTGYTLADMVDPVGSLFADWKIAAKTAARNEAKNKLAKLIREINEYKSDSVEQDIQFGKMGRIVPSYLLRNATQTKQLAAAEGKTTLTAAELDNAQRDLTLEYFENGQRMTIVFEEDMRQMAEALIQAEAADSMTTDFDYIITGFKKVHNYFRPLLTTANLIFNINNFFRDLADAMQQFTYIKNVMDAQSNSTGKSLGRIAAEQAKAYYGIFTTVLKTLNSNSDSRTFNVPDGTAEGKEMTTKELWGEAVQNGMKMSWAMLDAELEQKTAQEIADIVNSRAAKAERRAARSNFENAIRDTGSFAKGFFSFWTIHKPEKNKAMEVMNMIADKVENTSRFAAYVYARQQGASPQQAANIGRNITINFEKAGTILKRGQTNQFDSDKTKTIKAAFQLLQGWFLFIRPAIQGARKVVQRLSSKEGMVATGVGLLMNGLRLQIFNLVNDEDEKMAFYTNEYGFKNYYYIPLGNGKNLEISKAYSVDRVTDNLLTNIAGSQYTGKGGYSIVFDAFKDLTKLMQPVDMTGIYEKGVYGLAPTFATPVAELAANVKFGGGRPLRNLDDLAESIDPSMTKGTYVFGQKVWNDNIYMRTAAFNRKWLGSLGNTRYLGAPQGLKHLAEGYVLDQGMFKLVNRAAKSMSAEYGERLARDKGMTEADITLARIGKAVPLLSFSEGKSRIAAGFWQTLNEPAPNVDEFKKVYLRRLETQLKATAELGYLDSDLLGSYKSAINKWWGKNSQKIPISMMADTPLLSSLLSDNAVDKQIDAIQKSKGKATKSQLERGAKYGHKVDPPNYDDAIELRNKLNRRDR